MYKRSTLFYIFILTSINLFISAKHIRTVSVFVQEEIIAGTEFSNSIKSDSGKTEELFFINKMPVQKEDYYKELESAQLTELRKEREKAEKQKRNKIDFANDAQINIIEKIITRHIQKATQILNLLENDQLKPYFIFQQETVDSLQKFIDVKQFISNIAALELKTLVSNKDIKGLQELQEKIEQWPDKLETFFQKSVQNAIKNSDDTKMLKELFTLISM